MDLLGFGNLGELICDRRVGDELGVKEVQLAAQPKLLYTGPVPLPSCLDEWHLANDTIKGSNPPKSTMCFLLMHQDQSLSKREFWMLRENPRFFFLTKPKFALFSISINNWTWENLTLNRFRHSVITCWVFNSPNQQEIYSKLCGQTITQNNRKKKKMIKQN